MSASNRPSSLEEENKALKEKIALLESENQQLAEQLNKTRTILINAISAGIFSTKSPTASTPPAPSPAQTEQPSRPIPPISSIFTRSAPPDELKPFLSPPKESLITPENLQSFMIYEINDIYKLCLAFKNIESKNRFIETYKSKFIGEGFIISTSIINQHACEISMKSLPIRSENDLMKIISTILDIEAIQSKGIKLLLSQHGELYEMTLNKGCRV